MDQNAYEILVQAITTVYTPGARPDQIRLAQEYCETFKTREPNLVPYAFALFQQQNPDEIRFFGLHLLEHTIRTRWQSIKQEDRELLKTATLELLATKTKDMAVEKGFIKEKLVAVVVDMAVQDWPQQWKNFMDLLVQIAAMGDTQLELILITLRALPEEIQVFNSRIKEKRRNALIGALRQALPDVFTFFSKFIEVQFTLFKQASEIIAQAGQQAPQEALLAFQKHKHLVTTVLNTVLSYCEWIPMRYIVAHNFSTIFCSLLVEEKFRMLACDCLLLLFGQTQAIPVEEQNNVLFPFEFMDTFAIAWTKKTSDQVDDYQFQKKLAQFIALVGDKHLKYHSTIPTNFDKFLTLMRVFAEHNSPLLSSFTFRYWGYFLASEFMRKQQFYLQMLSQILEVCYKRLPKLPWNLNEESIASTTLSTVAADIRASCEFLVVDFEDKTDYVGFVSTFRNKVLEIVQTVTSQQPEAVLGYVAERLQAFVNLQPDVPSSNKSIFVITFDSIILFLDCVMRTLSTEAYAQGKVLQYAEYALKLLFQYETKDPYLVLNQLSGLQSFCNYYEQRPDSLQFILMKIISFVVYRNPQEAAVQTPGNLSADTIKVRKKACSTLIHVCDEIPGSILPLLENLTKMIIQLQSEQQVLDGERVLLFEALVAVSNAMKNYEKQTNFLGHVLQKSIEEWTSPLLSSFIADTEHLMQFLGLLPIQGQAPTTPEQQQYAVRRMYHIVNSFHVVCKRSSIPTTPEELSAGGFVTQGDIKHYPMAFYLKQLLPNIFSLVRAIHSLWAPNVMAAVPQELKEIYMLDESFTSAVLGKEADSYDAQPQSAAKMQAKSIRSWLAGVRHTCYSMLGKMTSYGEDFYSLFPSISEVITTYIFANLEHVENHHLESLLRLFIVPLMANCPMRLWDNLYLNLLPPLLTFIGNRLHAGWTALISRGLPEEAYDDSSAENEIVGDKVLRDLTRDYSNWMNELMKVERADKKSELQPTRLFSTFITTENIAVPMLTTLIRCVEWPDSPSLSRALAVLRRTILILIAHVGRHKYLEPLLGRDLLVSAFKALSMNIGKNEAFSTSLLATVKDVYCHLHSRSAFPNQVLASLNVDKKAINQFAQKIAKEKTDEKATMAKFKRFLWPILSEKTKEEKEANILQQEKTFFEGGEDVNMGGDGGGGRKGKKKTKKQGGGTGGRGGGGGRGGRGGKGGGGGRGGKGGSGGGKKKGKGKGKAGKARRQNMWYNTTDSFDLANMQRG